jgi:hypothetical protein
MLKGCIDRIEGEIAGWAYDDDRPGESIAIDIYIAGVFYIKVLANQPREDLKVFRTGRTSYGFAVSPPPHLRADEIVFGLYRNEYLVQGPLARQSHLTTRVNHPFIIENVAPKHSLLYSGASTSSDVCLPERICRAVERAETDSAAEYGPLWGMLVASRHGDLIEIVKAGQSRELGAYLSELGRQHLAFGFFGGPDAHVGAETNAAFRDASATLIFDRILSLAEALGCIFVENPEQGVWGQVVSADLDELLDSIGAVLGISDLKPPVGGFWGLPTGRGLFNARALDALYAASRIATVRSIHDLRGVTEIGGGAGLAAHYSLMMGIAPYKIIDLPTVGAAQAYTLRDHKGLKLYGEDLVDARIELIPPWEFSAAPSDRYDLIFNMDSLPEIETDAAVGYLINAREMGYRYLLSINQESGGSVGPWSQGKVSSLAESAGGYTRISRHRDWMRPGYVEELYAINAA